MRTPTPLAASLLIAALAGGCVVPTGLYGREDVTVASILSGGAAVKLFELAVGGDEVAVPLTGDRPAMLVFHSRSVMADRLAVDIQPDRAAYRVQNAPAPAAFEPRLRGLEARYRKLAPAPARYRTAAATPVALGDQARFWVIRAVDGDDASEGRVTATARYVGAHCYVFVDNQLPAGRLEAQVAEIGQAFDEQIFPTDARLFGLPLASGVNGDPKVSILVSPAVGDYGNDATIGYFTVRDLFSPEVAPDDPVLARSNQRLMLYMSSSVVSRGKSADYLGTIAHELQHLINASQRLFRARRTKTEDVWLDEGLSMYAMEANGYGLGGAGGVVFDHVAGYQASPGLYSLTDWSANPDESGYGAVYLFTTYLVNRFGEGLLKELVDGSDVGVGNIDAVTAGRGSSFASAFNDWTLANVLDHTGLSSDPRYSYGSLNMLGTYGGRRLRGVHLEAVSLPNRAALSFKPTSARYYYVPRGTAGTYRFALSGALGQDFGGVVVTP